MTTKLQCLQGQSSEKCWPCRRGEFTGGGLGAKSWYEQTCLQNCSLSRATLAKTAKLAANNKRIADLLQSSASKSGGGGSEADVPCIRDWKLIAASGVTKLTNANLAGFDRA